MDDLEIVISKQDRIVIRKCNGNSMIARMTVYENDENTEVYLDPESAIMLRDWLDAHLDN